jgi:hypothetical protein
MFIGSAEPFDLNVGIKCWVEYQGSSNLSSRRAIVDDLLSSSVMILFHLGTVRSIDEASDRDILIHVTSLYHQTFSSEREISLKTEK